MARFKPEFLSELKTALASESHAGLADQVEKLEICEFVESRRPISQFIYVVSKSSLPEGVLEHVIVAGVAGLFCLFVHDGRIAIVETLSRDVLQRDAEPNLTMHATCEDARA